MMCLRTLGVFSVTLSLVWSISLETTSIRSISSSTSPDNNTVQNEPNKPHSNQAETNSTALDILDVRTPPKIQSQIKDKMSSKHAIESSHAGIAIPVDPEIIEESTKKMNFYKLERPTTANGGLSTWILLSGQTSSTTLKPTTKKPSVKPIIMKDDKSNETLMLSEKPIRAVRPVFKQRITTPRTIKNDNNTKTTTVRINTFSPSSKSTSKPTKLTKVKASLLHNLSTKQKNSLTKNNTNLESATATTVAKNANISTSTEPANLTTTILPAEAKDTDQELPSTEEKKKKIQKKKKNKNRRRKPSKASKEGNNKLKEVESPGTQLYSYLRSEIIPVTVGVSLVGLLVTAGLASYYLQPFAALRRSDPIDRKDTEGTYYYHNDYSNAMPEEEAIGKVIAGMPENTLQDNNRNSYKQNYNSQNVRYRHEDRRSQIYMNPYGSVEDVKLHDRAVNYDQRGEYSKDAVAGNDPKETVADVTPAVVPEHGPRNFKSEEKRFVVGNIPKEYLSAGASPRNLRIRKRRTALPDDTENEISQEDNDVINSVNIKQQTTTSKIDNITPTTITTISTKEAASQDTTEPDFVTTDASIKETTPHNIYNPSERPSTLLELFADLFKLKVKLGLELIQNITSSVSTYVSKVHSRLDEHYRKATRTDALKLSK